VVVGTIASPSEALSTNLATLFNLFFFLAGETDRGLGSDARHEAMLGSF